MVKKTLNLSRWHHGRWLRKAFKQVKGKVLDVGTGRGVMVRRWAKTRGDLELVTVDKEKKKGWRVDVVADGRDLPMKDKEFDGVIILDVLEHVEGPEKMVKEAVRVLKKGGVLYVTIPLEGAWWTMDWWLRRLFKIDWTKEIIGHINKFELGEVRRMFKEAGVRIEWVRYSHHWLYQLGSLIYFRYLNSLPKKELKPKKGFWLPTPWWIRLGIMVLGWLTIVESWVLSGIPGREIHLMARKV